MSKRGMDIPAPVPEGYEEFQYGNTGAIHGTTKANVEVDAQGRVVSVWFRCMRKKEKP